MCILFRQPMLADMHTEMHTHVVLQSSCRTGPSLLLLLLSCESWNIQFSLGCPSPLLPVVCFLLKVLGHFNQGE